MIYQTGFTKDLINNMIKLSQLVNELKLTDDMRIHMSKKPFELEPRTFTQKDELKPTGFWYGFGSEWIDWCRNEAPEWIGKYIYSVDIGNTNVLQIKTHMELMQFNREYQASLIGGINAVMPASAGKRFENTGKSL